MSEIANIKITIPITVGVYYLVILGLLDSYPYHLGITTETLFFIVLPAILTIVFVSLFLVWRKKRAVVSTIIISIVLGFAINYIIYFIAGYFLFTSTDYDSDSARNLYKLLPFLFAISLPVIVLCIKKYFR